MMYPTFLYYFGKICINMDHNHVLKGKLSVQSKCDVFQVLQKIVSPTTYLTSTSIKSLRQGIYSLSRRPMEAQVNNPAKLEVRNDAEENVEPTKVKFQIKPF